MDHGLLSLHRAFHRVGVGDVAERRSDGAGVDAVRFQRGRHPVRRAREERDVVPGADERRDGVRADVAGPPR
jgi:hypothetical protein